jgi:hypothetical protein
VIDDKNKRKSKNPKEEKKKRKKEKKVSVTTAVYAEATLVYYKCCRVPSAVRLNYIPVTKRWYRSRTNGNKYRYYNISINIISIK